MKTPRPLKNRRLAYALRQHGMSPGWIAQIRVLLNQCLHAHNMPEPLPD
jgi:hypothetical protein